MGYRIGDSIEVREQVGSLYIGPHKGKRGEIIPNTSSTEYKVKLTDDVELCLNTDEFINHSYTDRFIAEEEINHET